MTKMYPCTLSLSFQALCYVLMYLYTRFLPLFPFWHLKACHHHHADTVIKKKEYAISLVHFCREVGHG